MSENPSKVIDGLLTCPLKVGSITVRPFTLASQLIFEKLKHRVISETNPKLSLFESTEMVFVLAGDPEEVNMAVLLGGDDWKVSVLRFADRLKPEDLKVAVALVIRQINTAYAASPAQTEKKSPVTMPSMTSSNKSAAETPLETAGH